MKDSWIEVTREEHVAMVALNRTKHLNALSFDFAKEINDAFTELGKTDDVWVIILKSNARIFCSGLDLKDALSQGLIGNTKQMLNFPILAHNLFACCNVIEECKKPVIAAVHGMCVGGGLDIISACDFRLCTRDATFSLREARLGIVADMGSLQRLPYIIGQASTRHMAYTGRFFTAQEAERMGLVLSVHADQEALIAAAKKLAEEIKESAPLAVQNTKEILNFSRTASIQDGITLSTHKNMLLLTSRDCAESMTAFMEKRKPVFQGE